MSTDAERVPELVRSEVAYHGYTLDVTVDTLRAEDGRTIERTVVARPEVVAVVALDDEGRWLLVRQYRHGAGVWILEVPAGKRDPAEALEVAALRELREETGFAAASIERLGGTWTAPGFCSEYVTYFLGSGLHLDPLPHDAEEEFAPAVYLTMDEMRRAVASGEIEDAKTLVAMQLMALRT